MGVKQSDVNIKKYKLVAPDGGWGYLICVAFILVLGTQSLFLACFGMLYDDFLKEIGISSTGVTFVTGFNALCFAISGFLTDAMLKLLSKRKLSFIVVALYNLSTIGMIFAKSKYEFFLLQGILPGLALGASYNTISTVLNEYFDKKRLFAFSLVQFFIAVVAMVAPLFVKWSLQEFGYRGTLILIAGISMHTLIGVCLLQPVEWHMKREEILSTEETHVLILEEKTLITPSIQLGDEDAEINKDPLTVLPVEAKKSAIINVIELFVDTSFVKKFVLSCACMGPALCNFAEATFGLILPQALYANGWSQTEVALAISIYGFGDLAMRTIFTLTSNFLFKIGSQELYIIGLVIGCISKFGMIWSKNQILTYVFMAIMGVSRCFVFVLISMVLSDTVAPDKFTQGMGVFMLVCGVIMVVVGPIIGAVRDLTESYSTAFYFLTSLFAITVLFWSIELCYKKNKHKRKSAKTEKAISLKGK